MKFKTKPNKKEALRYLYSISPSFISPLISLFSFQSIKCGANDQQSMWHVSALALAHILRPDKLALITTLFIARIIFPSYKTKRPLGKWHLLSSHALKCKILNCSVKKLYITWRVIDISAFCFPHCFSRHHRTQESNIILYRLARFRISDCKSQQVESTKIPPHATQSSPILLLN